MKIWKRLLALCLALALLTSAIPTISADSPSKYKYYGNLEYYIDENSVVISGYKGEPPTSVVIPAEIDGYPVKSIGYQAFYECTELTAVILPEGLETIGHDAFSLTSLKEIILPSTICQINSSAFHIVDVLERVYIYSKHLSDPVFGSADRVYLYEEILPTNRIDSTAYCTFEECGCDPRTETIYTEGCMKYVLKDGEAYLMEATPVGDFTVPDTLGGCPVTRIAPRCFMDANELRLLTLPDTVRMIGRYATPAGYLDDPDCQASMTKLPKQLEYVGIGAFTGMDLSAITALPTGLQHIGVGAFNLCGLTSMRIPGTLKVIPDAFKNNPLTEVVLEDGVEKMLYGCFNMSTGKITIPPSVTEVGQFWETRYTTPPTDVKVYGAAGSAAETLCIEKGIAFYDWETGETTPLPYDKEIDGVKYAIFPAQNYAAVSKLLSGHAETLVIPETVDGVPVEVAYDWAFTSESLKSLYLPDTVKNLNDFAVEGCPNLEYVRLSENLETIGSACFLRCDKLKAVYIPESVESIGDSFFTDSHSTVIVGKAGSYAKTYAAVNGYPFVEAEDGKEYMIRGGVYRKEADGLVVLSLPITIVDDTYAYCAVPDEVEGIPVVGIDGEVQFPGFTHSDLELHLGSNVRFIEEGALTDTKVTILYATPALEELPVPLFSGEGEIYALSDTYAESYAKEHGVFFYPIDGTPFTDVPEDSWFFPSVYFCYWNGLMNGTSKTTFQPGGTSSRAMLVTILYRLCGDPYLNGDGHYFRDVPENSWYAFAVDWAAENGVVYGTSASTFSPNASVTREQVAAILYRLGDLLGKDVATFSPLTGFNDAAAVSEYAKTALMWAVDVGILRGTDKNMLNPKGAATRAEMATILLRYIAWLEA